LARRTRSHGLRLARVWSSEEVPCMMTCLGLTMVKEYQCVCACAKQLTERQDTPMLQRP